MSVVITYQDHDFAEGFPRHVDVLVRNVADHINVEQKKLAPYFTGALMKSLQVNKIKDGEYEIVPGVPYAIRRNFENHLHPQTLHYIERSIDNTARGISSQWWKSN